MRGRTDATDHELVECVRAGDDQAFERLYHRYHRRIAAYIYGMVHDYGRAEDLTQDVFMSALRRMRETDRPIAFKPWVYEIAKNACIDAFRRSRRAEEVSYDADEGLGAADHGRLVTTGPTPDVAVDTKMSLDHLRGAFGGLSEAHHQILVMRELEGLSYREIGERLGMSRPSVESTLFRARRRLSEEYEELVTGRRCLRVQALISQAGESVLGARDQRRLSRHISHCQPCRRHARLAGLDVAVVARRPVREKIAALLPLPAFLRQRWGGGGDSAGSSLAASHSPAFAQLSNTAAQYGDSVAGGWAKAVIAAAAVAVAGVGANTAATTHALKPGASLRDDAIVTQAISPRTPEATAATPAARPGAASGAATRRHAPARHRTGAGTTRRDGGGGGGGGTSSGGSTSTSGSTTSTASSPTRAVTDSTSGTTGGALDTVTKIVTSGGSSGSGTSSGSGDSGSGISLPDPTRILPPPPTSGSTTSGSDPVSGTVQQVGDTVGQVTDTVDTTVDQTTTTVTGVLGGGG